MSVINGNDSGIGSLRDQIDNTTASVIVIDSSVTLITLASSITIPRNITIIGSNTTITLSGAGVFGTHVFICDPSMTIGFQNIVFVGNPAVGNVGVAITNTIGSGINVDNCSFTNWIWSTGDLILLNGVSSNIVVTNSSFSNNQVGFLTRSHINAGASTIENTIENCQITNNVMFNGGFHWDDFNHNNVVSLTYRNLIFDGNTIDQTVPTPTSHNLISAENDGGPTATVLIVDNIEITNNIGILRCVGIHLFMRNALSASITRIRVLNNSSTGANDTDTLGLRYTSAGLSALSPPRTFNVDNVFVQNNTSNRRVGVMISVTQIATSPLVANVNNVCIMNNTSTDAGTMSTPAFNLMGTDGQINLSNIMIGYNTSTTVGGMRVAEGLTKILRNVSIVGNVGPTVGGLFVDTGASAPILFNTLIADNWSDTARTIRSDVLGTVGSNSFYNLIADGTGMTGITNGVNGNQVGTSLAPIDAMLGMPGNYGGSHNFTVVPLLEGSPAIDAGDNVYIPPGMDYDVRGSAFTRIYNTTVDIGAFEWEPFIAPCYLADTPIKVKDKDGQIKVLKAEEVIAGQHQVYDMVNEKFIDVVNNARVQGVEVVYEIPPHHFAENVPAESLFITSGHLVSVDGKPTKMRDIPGAIKHKIPRSDVYSIICNVWTPIDMSGVGVYSWSKHKWDAYTKKKGIVWTESKW